MSAARRVLCLNAGSSSLKVAVYEVAGEVITRTVGGTAERLGSPEAHLRVRDADGRVLVDEALVAQDAAEAAERVLAHPSAATWAEAEAVGHRVVHGGAAFDAPVRIDDTVLAKLERQVPLAPLHLPVSLRVIERLLALRPRLPQVACFDTAFHRTLPAVARRFALPRHLTAAGVRRYGFHGLSLQFVVEVLGADLPPRTVVAHLGNGASLTALRDGVSVDTTMGLTPCGGVPMGTRPGDLDPGVLTYLLRSQGMDAAALEHLVNHESGLRGVSGGTTDMRALLEHEVLDPAAVEAIETFCYGVTKAIGALAAVLGGLDGLVFTGGIGEHAAPVRDRICAPLGFLGIALDAQANAAHAAEISRGPCVVRVVATDEDRIIARETARVIGWNRG